VSFEAAAGERETMVLVRYLRVVLPCFSYEQWWFYHVLAMNNGGFTMF
jgi:hypothetical protein